MKKIAISAALSALTVPVMMFIAGNVSVMEWEPGARALLVILALFVYGASMAWGRK